MTKQQIGLIGLAVMGENLALNIERQGFSVAVYNRTGEKTKTFMAERGQNKQIQATYSLEEFVHALASPRKVLIMVKAGAAVDAVIDQLKPLLDPGDILIDGGNSCYEDTERRAKALQEDQIEFLGMGVSGGGVGALIGPSLMPGGSRTAYDILEPILTQMAAQVEEGHCVTYLGPRSAGHYVKTVHNGIEYGLMQLIAEAYDLLSQGLGLQSDQLHRVFADWNHTPELGSYLLEITADIFQHSDSETGKPLVNLILDQAEQHGTGQWTVRSALDLGVPVPTIAAGVGARVMSAYKPERVQAAQDLNGSVKRYQGNASTLIAQLQEALYCGMICAFAEGIVLLRHASEEFDYQLPLAEVARIWQGGCIIRAKLLHPIQAALTQAPELPNLLLAPEFKDALLQRQDAWRQVLAVAQQLAIPLPALHASWDYFQSYRRDRLPQNLTQAQRDYFGSHTYERLDQTGTFHTCWTDLDRECLETGTTD